MKTLAILFGDQLDAGYPEALGLDRDRDVIAMFEVTHESTDPPSNVQRTVLFLSAMRHFAEELRGDGWEVDYVSLMSRGNTNTFEGEIERAIKRHKVKRCVCIRPGEWRVLDLFEEACEKAGVQHEVVEDPHFLCSVDDFGAWAEGRKTLTMEYFYREQRKKLGVLMDGKDPVGGDWNFDKENRKAFKQTPRAPSLRSFQPDDITKQVIDDVGKKLPDLPGSLENGFHWPVTRKEALIALRKFVNERLPKFGDYQDAMWTNEHTLYHSLISTSINLKLLNPREVYQKAVEAYEAGDAPLNSVEGFVRQIIGWREFIRGVYWTQGRGYAEGNALRQHGDLPEFYWSGETDMACMSSALESVIGMGYGHHIERLMVTGNFALIAGVHPGRVNDWYLGMYADAVHWVTTPNTLGMAMHADGAVVGTKPYSASGKYIKRMSNFCEHCRYRVQDRIGANACPFNVFYWDFLIRHRETFAKNNRMAMILKNVDRLKDDERVEITSSARKLRERFGVGEISR